MIHAHAHTHTPTAGRLRQPIMWGLLVGSLQAASPIAFWWLQPATVHGMSIAFIAAVYIGFAIADGRTRVITVEIAGAAQGIARARVLHEDVVLHEAYAATGGSLIDEAFQAIVGKHLGDG